jgi:CubicO group peptidase (beta-lactamase class C family)
MTRAIDAVLEAAVARGDVAGVVAMAANRDGVFYQGAAGVRAAGTTQAMTADTVFWIASMTKAITSVAAMMLVEEGTLALDAPIGDVLPALAAPQVLDGFAADGTPRLRPARTTMTLRHLLTHTSGFSYERWSADLAAAHVGLGLRRVPTNWDELAREPLLFDPGTDWSYSISTDVVGKAVEAASGLGLAEFLQTRICAPLGMADSTFLLTEAQRARLARVHQRQPDGALLPIEHPVGQGRGFLIGGGGMCGTAGDYIRLLRLLLGGGALDGVRLLAPETVAEMSRNQIGDLKVRPMRTADPQSSADAEFFPGMVQKWGLGFLINTERAPSGRSPGGLAWAGLGNTYYWIDPSREVAGVVMTQSLPFADPRALALLWAFEYEVYRLSES